MKQINLRVSDDLLAKIDEACGAVPRERWLRAAIEYALEGDARGPLIVAGTASATIAGPYPGRVVTHSIRQPEPNVTRYRSSAQAKSASKPVPKGGKS